MNVVLSLVDAGDEVILPAPYWVSYADMTNLAGGKVVTVQTGIEQDFKMTADQLRDALTERTRIVMVNSPNNPSGSVYTEEEMAALAAVLRGTPGPLPSATRSTNTSTSPRSTPAWRHSPA